MRAFKKEIWTHYRKYGRDLPWRGTTKPYHILVSEVMLQQTQAERVIPKYHLFLKTYPSVHKLAHSSLRDVLILWQGLGYNRRAKALHEGAKIIVQKYKGVVPKSRDALLALPGIGSYTAGAIRTFAFNRSDVFIETNIRTVFICFFFKRKKKVYDREILELVRKTLPRNNSREWFHALMDYGTMLKKKNVHANVQSAHYTKQGRFEGSNRQLRGQIMKIALKGKVITQKEFENLLLQDSQKIGDILGQLTREGFFARRDNTFILA